MPGDRIVYVIAKAPTINGSKTRLSPPLAPEQAVELARAFLLDAVEIARAADIDVCVMCRSDADRERLHGLLGSGTAVSVQRGRGLGSALESAFAEGLAAGYRGVAVFGADSPTLDPRILGEAFRSLDAGADVALGPSLDGGYYLLAARAAYPSLFRGMPWGTSSVARRTLQACEMIGLSVQALPLWYDVDDWAGLAQLRAEIVRGRAARAWNTRHALGLAGVGADAGPVKFDLATAHLAPHATV